MTFDEFFSEFSEQVEFVKDNDDYGWEEQDFFTSVILDYLEDVGEVESPVICPYRAYGVQMNAYVFSEDYEILTIYVSIYYLGNEIKSALKTDIDAAIKRAMQVYRRATNDLYKSFEKDNDTYEFAHSVYKHKADTKHVNIVALTNGNCKPIPFKNVKIGVADVSFSIWDMDRLYRCISSGKMRETIEIDFKEMFGQGIPCLVNKDASEYEACLAIIPGNILASVYAEHGSRLLEKNVRSFLQVKGNVNKGIRNTLKMEPEMFLAYNNGISVTAESVTVESAEDGSKFISKIRDMQIVNGGQTTASIYNITKEKDSNVDLAKVYVQMKITVIKAEEKMDEMVHKISEYANTQNKVQMADFSSNDPFNRKIEDLSRVIWAPATNGQKPNNWFFERARGQYSDMLSREGTPAKRKAYKATHPLFTKTDMAKYENTWNQLPYFVSEGAQKNFKRFMVSVKERGNFVPDEKYYQLLVAKAIMYRRTEKLVSEQKYGGYRANIVTYTLALISHKSAQRIDLFKIWREQGLTDVLENEIVRASGIVQKFIVNPPGGANVSEYCKKKSCWDNLLKIDYEISEELRKELISGNENESVLSSCKTATMLLNDATDEEKELIDRITAIPADVWLSISKWAKDTNNLQSWQRSISFSVGTLIGRGKRPSVKQARQAEIIYNAAKEKGFIEE
ncbi:AIPR family protein [Mediterraneibacter gnavus]|uniref:AIPR family protein n=1 Tax=Mediterraneibacter gnavus TaxID=33038 RepID=A0A9X3HLQ6_MEDGN|nr:AIPR family protein [Mediterraneibacter gnavus]MCZ7695219.1 AIPR family protein [Mediterraneibacter gnavus]MCZ7736780.1 AIPR family protein [Mediterraneibacter gnavus]MDC6148425.1 AIPR family protein [Mediterraneibacter gnavus]MDE1201842.1 AIPR family protein [Mediterraneibacter gnavus]